MINGQAGIDIMLSGLGDDRYFVHDAPDVVTEAAGAGIDTVVPYPNDWQFVNYTLPAQVENVDVSGHWQGMNVTGNGLVHDLLGSPFADVLDGGSGTDTLRGGAGADGYRFGRGFGADTVVENDAAAGVVDYVQFPADVLQTQVGFARAGNNLEATITGTLDKLVVKDWYLGSAYRVEEFRFVGGTVTLASQVQALGSAMAAFGADSAQIGGTARDAADSAMAARNAQWRAVDLLAAA